MVKLFDYDVVYLRVEHNAGYIEANSLEEAENKMKEAADKQNLIGFRIKTIKQSDFEIPNYDDSDSEDVEAIDLSTSTPPKTLN